MQNTTAYELGKIFKQRRKEMKLSQIAVAARAGVTRGRYGELENHPDRIYTITTSTLSRILEVLEFKLILKDMREEKKRC